MPAVLRKSGTVEEFKGETKAYPAVVFCHGSSGVNPQIKIFAQWLADALRVAVVVPDSMQTEDRLTYSSPVPAADYEIIHQDAFPGTGFGHDGN